MPRRVQHRSPSAARQTRSARGVARIPDWKLLGAALRNLGDGAVIADRRWNRGGVKILFANEAFCAMTGYTAAELVGHSTRLFHGPKSDAARLRRWLGTAGRGQVDHGEGFLYRKTGSMFYVAWSYSLLDDAAGRPRRVVAVYRDMTEMRRLQDTLIHSQRLDAVGQLAGGVAHDFNNLLSVINGYCEILSGRLTADGAARRDLEEIHKAGQKAAGLTRQLLAFSRRQEMDPKVINLNQIIRELSELLRRLVGPASTLQLDLAVDLGNIRVDPALMQQVILNLVINARDALPAAGGAVTVRTANNTVPPHRRSHSASEIQPGRYAVLAVQDTGEGMDSETQRRMFEPFFTTKEPGKGTGLGLSTVYGIVKQSGGYVTVQSDPRAGSNFAIYLPEVSEPADAYKASLLPLPDTRGRETILLLEEDDLVGKMVAGILTAEGYEVLAANRPADALAMAKRHGRPIDLLIADLTEPKGCGLELARELHALKPGFRILCTSNLEEARPVSWLPAAHQAHIVKPFALHQVLRLTRELLDAKMVL
jgi:PAS domain S-box-containing protein